MISKAKYLIVTIISLVLIFISLLSYNNSITKANVPTYIYYTLSEVNGISKVSYVSGYYDEYGSLVSDANYLSINNRVSMSSNAFMVNLPNEFIRMEIKEFDENSKFIKSTDIAHLDYFMKNENTSFIKWIL